MNYLDFWLRITSGDSNKYEIEVSSDEGEASEEIELPFSDEQLKLQIAQLEKALARSERVFRRSIMIEEQAIQEFSQKLFRSVFTGRVRSLYDKSYKAAECEKKGLRIRLQLPGELAVLPWEYLYDPHSQKYICLSIDTPLVRHPKVDATIETLAVSAPLKILGVVANPEGTPGLSVQREKERMEKALYSLLSKRLVELYWLEEQTADALQSKLQESEWHILHFIGHGGYNARAGEGTVVFADENGMADPKTATQLGYLLSGRRSLRLAVINACEGARSDEHDIFSGIASNLIQRGIPAVLAMQYNISDDAAIKFSEAFYTALANGCPVDQAVSEARIAVSLSRAESLEWGVPVLHMHAKDGRLFDVQPGDERLQEAPHRPRRQISLWTWLGSHLWIPFVIGILPVFLIAFLWFRELSDFFMSQIDEKTVGVIALLLSGIGLGGSLMIKPPITRKVIEAFIAGVSLALLIVVLLMLFQPLPIPSSAPTPTSTLPPPPTTSPTSTVSFIPPISSTPIEAPMPMEIILVPSGKFQMGNEEEGMHHSVDLAPFWIDKTEVTNAMFARFVEGTGYKTQAERLGRSDVFSTDIRSWQVVEGANWQHPLGPGSDISELLDHPVVHVGWHDAAAYCEWVGGRLPTEAEWEKAARGANGARKYPWGDQTPTGNLANFADKNAPVDWAFQNENDGYHLTAPAGSYLQGASPYGVLDMAGNVFEWVSDWLDENYDDTCPRVLKGGAWASDIDFIRIAKRIGDSPMLTNDMTGFRCAKSTSELVNPIAFASEKPGNDDIYVINANGSGLLQLTIDTATDTGPSWSPDASQIVFTSNRNGFYQLFVMDADGGNQHLLIEDNFARESPNWSPANDGRIAFISRRDEETESGWIANLDVYVIGKDGQEQRLTTHPASDMYPVWSPDGTKIMFLSERDSGDKVQSDLYVMEVALGEASVRRLTHTDESEGNAVWSPDGERILFISEMSGARDVYLMNADGTDIQKLADKDYDRNPSFAPDGKRFVFDSSVNGRQLFLVSLLGGAPEQIQTGLAKSWGPSWSSEEGDERILFTGRTDGDWEIYTLQNGRDYALRLTDNTSNEIQPRVSPDGNWIAFATNQGGAADKYKICLTSARVPSDEWTCLTDNQTNDRYPAWSPDGGRLAFASQRDGNWEIYVINRDGSGLERLTAFTDDIDQYPAWSPDGQFIFFYSTRTGNGDIHRMDADGKNRDVVSEISNEEFDWSPAVSPDGRFLAFASSRDTGSSYHNELYLLNLVTGELRRLTYADGPDETPVWSWDGLYIYFTSARDWGIDDIWIMDIDGEDQTNQTKDLRQDILGGP
ncbi:MAG: PD40 domain-containing protein [Anaerolineales bacterium]|nr:PD40 domain-containing protein [Anaerolineales bacterium]